MNPTPTHSLIRPACQAGRFYEADPARLRATIGNLLAQAPPVALESPPLGLVAPHAGYIYSGAIAAAAYRVLLGRAVDGVLLLAPSHTVDFSGAALPASTAFATPLGEVAIDTMGVAELADRPGFRIDEQAHDAEHAIEVQLPFLQVVLERPFTLLPLALGRPPHETALEPLLGELLALLRRRAAQGEDWLILSSTDTYHGADGEACATNDIHLAQLIERLAVEELLEQCRRRAVMACGWLGLVLAAALARELGAREGRILARGDSRSGRESVSDYIVGYLAAALV